MPAQKCILRQGFRYSLVLNFFLISTKFQARVLINLSLQKGVYFLRNHDNAIIVPANEDMHWL